MLYLAPPFQDETGASLTKPGSGYVLLTGDFIRGANLLRIPATTDPAPPQPTQNPINIHLLDTYLQKGSRSAQQFVDNYTAISTYVCDSISRGGGGGKQAPLNANPCGQQPSGAPTTGGTSAPPSGGTSESPTEQPSTGGTTEQPSTGQTPPGSPQTSMTPQTPGHSGCCGQPQGPRWGPAADEDKRRTRAGSTSATAHRKE